MELSSKDESHLTPPSFPSFKHPLDEEAYHPHSDDALSLFPHFLLLPTPLFPDQAIDTLPKEEHAAFVTSIRQHHHEVAIPSNLSSFSYQVANLAARISLCLKATNHPQIVLLRSHPSSDSFFVLNRLLIDFFALTSKNSHKLHRRILASHRVLAALGCVSTNENFTVLKFAHVTNLVLHPKRKNVIGAKVSLALPLENLSCPQNTAAGGASFNILAYLMAGTTSEEKYRYKLHHVNWPTHMEVDEAYDQYHLFLQGLKTLGFSRASQASIVHLLVAVLHLLHLQFVETRNELSGEFETQARHPELLTLIASLLGVPLNDFHASLVSQSSLVGKDVCSVMLTPDQAKERAFNMAQLLYRTFFHWLLDFINNRLAPSLEPFTVPLTLKVLHFPPSPLATPDATSVTLDIATSSFTSTAMALEPFLDHFVSKSFLRLHSAYHQDNILLLPLATLPSSGKLALPKSIPTVSYQDPANRMEDIKEFFHAQAQDVLIHAMFTSTIDLSKASHTTLQEDLQFSSSNSALANPFFVLPARDVSESTLDWMRSHIEHIPHLQYHVTQISLGHMLQRYAVLLPKQSSASDTSTKVAALLDSLELAEESNWVLGSDSLWCSLDTLVQLEAALSYAKAERRRNDEFSDSMSYASDADTALSDVDSNFEDGLGTSYAAIEMHDDDGYMHRNVPPADEERGIHAANVRFPVGTLPRATNEKAKVSSTRRRWLRFVWLLTWLVPSKVLSCLGMQAKEVQIAWREKVAICICIFWLSMVVLFLIVGAGLIICPRRNIYSLGELSAFSQKDKLYTSVYGRLYSLNSLMVTSTNPFHNNDTLFPLAAQDTSIGFPRTPLSSYCGLVKDPTVQLGANSDSPFRTISTSHQSLLKKDPLALDNYLSGRSRIVGDLAFEKQVLVDGWKQAPPKMMFIMDNTVYDITLYFSTLSAMNNFPAYQFLGSPNSSSSTLSLAQYIPLQGSQGIVDLTDDANFRKAWANSAVSTCFNNIFRAGVLDDRRSLKCLVTDYVLLSMSIILCCLILFKFLAALMLGGSTVTPASVDKFVILQVPCYTEDEQSLRNTLKSLAVTRYDDKRKLIFVLCDGMIVGRGNDKPTPRIVLDLLGHPPEDEDPTPQTYQAIGVGGKQVNRARVYSGLYTVNGHVVPYIVVAKCGREAETIRPGNRGKRDSQMVLMRYLNHVHYKKPMSPLEIELRHHMENIIGVDPSWYEYVLMVDADTVVDNDSLGKLVSYAMTDLQIIGCCGETRIVNEKSTITTMIQVYEYFISHHLSKAFESMFGTVTCLPGCFSMYRIKHSTTDKPLLVSDAVVDEYADVNVNTLHKKNLLTLGEDRYLTTLILKAFPRMKTKFTSSAGCSTFVPESFSVLLSQRRRWINSTFHNLFELVWLNELCGFCCFSMRFVVLIDLVSTIIMPATVVYLIYLIYLTVMAVINDQGLNLVIVSLILIAAIYGLQAIVFILKKEFSHIIWMVFYLLAIPLFGFFLPIYSFWNMDDFSWGNTRVVMGDKGEKKVVLEESDTFEPSSISHVTWEEHVAGLQEIMSPEPARPSSHRESVVSRRSSVNSRHSFEGSYPSDAELTYEIERILDTTDLMKISKRQVRERLCGLFGVDLTHRKMFISNAIDEYLRSAEYDR